MMKDTYVCLIMLAMTVMSHETIAYRRILIEKLVGFNIARRLG
jgi:hypothetical protein